MSAIDDIIEEVMGAIDKIDDAASILSRVEQETDQALEQAVALGDTAGVEAFTQLKEEVEQILSQVMGAGEASKQVLATARAVADSRMLGNGETHEGADLWR